MTKEFTRQGNTVSFQMVIPGDQIEKKMQEVYLKNKNSFQLPGFRKGKAPRQLLERTYGADLFFEDGVNECIPEIYEETTNEMGLKLAGQPQITLDSPYTKGQDVVLNVEVEVLPEFEVKDYSKIEIAEIKYEVSDELVYNKLQEEKEKARRATPVERQAKLGDVTVIDFEGFIDDEAFEGGKGEDFPLELGSGQFIPGFEDQLVGAKAGDQVDVNVSFPENYGSEELSGKDATFKVTVKEVQEIEYPEIDDEFIKDISEFDTVEEYKADTRKNLEEEFAEREKAEVRQAVLRKVADLAEFEVPEAILENAVDREIENFSANLRQYGIDFDQYAEMSGTNAYDLRDDFREPALINSKIQLIMEKIIEQEKIDATEDELKAEIQRLAELYFPTNEEEQKKFIDLYSGKNAEFVKDDLVFNKALDMLVENVVFVEPKEADPVEKAEETQENKKETIEERNKRIADLYETGDYTQEQLAEKEDLSPSTISRIIREAKKDK
ncbi:MAG: trigger factor [Bacillota bacterium]|nr:trigger factor [Bacillota bacterium]